MIDFQEFNGDQRREIVNSQQRYDAFREALKREHEYRGSMVWRDINGREYLVRSHYAKSGVRRQTSLGLRSKETEAIKRDYEQGRAEARDRLANLRAVIDRQSAVNRALGLGRVPLAGAKIIRALDQSGMLGSGIRILGTNAIYAYEAAAGVRIDPSLLATDDIDLLFDARSRMTFIASDDTTRPSLLRLLQKVDPGFRRSFRKFRAENREGYLVDLIKPLRDPPWTKEKDRVGSDADDLLAAEIEGLVWQESAPVFEAVAIDERGEPLRIVTTDPRVWVAHKLWVSKRPDREPIKRRNDAAQAQVIGQLIAKYMPNLPYAANELRMLPKAVFEDAAPLFRQ